jgi:hypothetical protein
MASDLIATCPELACICGIKDLQMQMGLGESAINLELSGAKP